MYCYNCSQLLDDNNWLPSRKNRNQYICKYCIRQDNNKRYKNKKIQYLSNIKNKYKLIKKEVFDHYGGKCQLCNESNYENLSLDHIDKNGRRHRKSVLKIDSGSQFYKWVHKHKPNNIRILCFNCNCQHSMTKHPLLINNIDYLLNKRCKYCNSNNNIKKYVCRLCQNKQKHNCQINLKIKAYQYFGSACTNCGCSKLEFLTIDHVNNDGAMHRKKFQNIYSWLNANNYPKNNFQILCFNCNYLKSKNIN
jgi:hypothetical protein